jgi:hypothetical protein
MAGFSPGAGSGRFTRYRRRFIGAGVGTVVGVLPPILPPPEPPPGGSEPPSIVRIGTTRDDSELVRTLPIARRDGKAERVVMSLGPSRLPTLRPGDRATASAEVEVSTTCLERSRRCIGRPYRFNPLVSAELVLANESGLTRGPHAMPISRRKSIRCHQQRPNRNHHCVIVFSHVKHVVRRNNRPCGGLHCHLNLVMSASHPTSRRGDRVVVGTDTADGRVAQDRGRVNLVRFRDPEGTTGSKPVTSAGRAETPLTDSLPVARPGKPPQKQVVYSMQLADATKGEMLSVAGNVETSIGHLDSNVHLGSRLILAPSATATTPGAVGRAFGNPHGEISEGNGFNCTQGPSAFETPCATRKVGVQRIRRDAVDPEGQPVPLYVNLVVGATATLREPGGKFAQVTGGSLKVIRYAPSAEPLSRDE